MGHGKRHSFVGGVRTKRCSVCKKHKPVSQFYAEVNGAEGLRSNCKKCTDTQRAVFIAKNPERVRLQKNASYHLNKDQVKLKRQNRSDEEKAQEVAYKTQYREDNKEKIAEYNRNYNATQRGKELSRDRCKKSRAKNREAYNEAERVRQTKSRTELSDAYITRLLVRTHKRTHDEITRDMIEDKRAYIKLYRENQPETQEFGGGMAKRECSICGEKKAESKFYAFRRECKECFKAARNIGGHLHRSRAKQVSRTKEDSPEKLSGEKNRCKTCGKLKAIEHFSRQKATSERRRTDCKLCVREYQRGLREKKKGGTFVQPARYKTDSVQPPTIDIESLTSKVLNAVKEFGPCAVGDILHGLWVMYQDTAVTKLQISTSLAGLKKKNGVKLTSKGWALEVKKKPKVKVKTKIKPVPAPLKPVPPPKPVIKVRKLFAPIFKRGQEVKMKNGDNVTLKADVFTSEEVSAISLIVAPNIRVLIDPENIVQVI